MTRAPSSERQAAAAERERLLEAERVARAEAERASRVKDDFVAMVSHELRTPLNAILSWTQLMMRSRNDPAILDRGLSVVSRNTRLQAQLISDLMDVSRIVAGKLQLDVQSVDVESIIRDAVETLRQEAETKGIVVQTSLEATGPVSGDPARIQQVVWNLLANAIKFTPQRGHVAVTLRDTESQVEIAVSDDGTGIRPCRTTVRLEMETVDGQRIVHNYGHGGAGVTLSWGCAVEVVSLCDGAAAHGK